MKVYAAEEDADKVEHVWFWGRNVTGRATEVAVWLGFRSGGLGYVDLVRTEGGHIVSTDTKRYYGPIVIKFKEAKK